MSHPDNKTGANLIRAEYRAEVAASARSAPVNPLSAGIHPGVACLALPLDFALARIDAPTGLDVPPAAIIACAALIPLCMLIQRRTFGDPWSLGLAKGLAVGCFTALPTVLFSVLTAAWAVMGAFDLAAGRGGAGGASSFPGTAPLIPVLDAAPADEEASRALAELDHWLSRHPIPEKY